MTYIVQVIILCIIGISILFSLRPPVTVKNKKITGLNGASIVYTDEKEAELLYAPKSNIQGKPDYIFKTWFLGHLIPFEIKSTTLKEENLHEGDLMQLAAYFVLIEEVYGKKPPYGMLVYANKSIKVRNTRRLRKELNTILWEMRQMLEGNLTQETEASFIKCKNCICKLTVCEWYEGRQ